MVENELHCTDTVRRVGRSGLRCVGPHGPRPVDRPPSAGEDKAPHRGEGAEVGYQVGGGSLQVGAWWRLADPGLVTLVVQFEAMV